MVSFQIDNLKKFLFFTLLLGTLLALFFQRRLPWGVAFGAFLEAKLTDESDYERTVNFDGDDKNQKFGEEGRDYVRVAVGGGITSKQYKTSQYHFGLVQPFFESFCSTASGHFAYDFYFAYDSDDLFFNDEESRNSFVESFANHTRQSCRGLSLSLSMIRCRHSKSPAWAQNDAMVEAYLDGAEFFYRVNDDTVFDSAKWTETFVRALARFRPPNFGVVGPTHTGGELSIMTYDFVHRTHVDAFGFYYPRRFTDWFADSWMTYVYPEKNALKVPDVRVKHVMTLGTRYNPTKSRRKGFDELVNKSRDWLRKYQLSLEHPVTRDGKKVVSMSLYGNSTKLNMGAIRNAQLFPVFFPGWTLRFYAYYKKGNHSNEALLVPARIVRCLRRLGAHVVPVDLTFTELKPDLWSYLVTEDVAVDYFLVRSALNRITSLDREAAEDFIRNYESRGKTSDLAFHCITDRVSGLNLTLAPNSWGGSSRALRDTFGTGGFLKMALNLTSKNRLFSEDNILPEWLWQKHKEKFLCHDSLSCEGKLPSVVKFPGNSSFVEKADSLHFDGDGHQNLLNPSLETATKKEICNSAIVSELLK